MLVSPGGFAEAQVAQAIADLYAPHGVALSKDEQAAFAGNAIALSDDVVWMSARAARALAPATREALGAAGFQVRPVELDGIEAGGGSLRCCVAEIF